MKVKTIIIHIKSSVESLNSRMDQGEGKDQDLSWKIRPRNWNHQTTTKTKLGADNTENSKTHVTLVKRPDLWVISTKEESRSKGIENIKEKNNNFLKLIQIVPVGGTSS